MSWSIENGGNVSWTWEVAYATTQDVHQGFISQVIEIPLRKAHSVPVKGKHICEDHDEDATISCHGGLHKMVTNRGS